jgi:hypothetical protein
VPARGWVITADTTLIVLKREILIADRQCGSGFRFQNEKRVFPDGVPVVLEGDWAQEVHERVPA